MHYLSLLFISRLLWIGLSALSQKKGPFYSFGLGPQHVLIRPCLSPSLSLSFSLILFVPICVSLSVSVSLSLSLCLAHSYSLFLTCRLYNIVTWGVLLFQVKLFMQMLNADQVCANVRAGSSFTSPKIFDLDKNGVKSVEWPIVPLQVRIV